MQATKSSLRIDFFNFLFGEEDGYLCIGKAGLTKQSFRQYFFKWPEQKAQVNAFVQQTPKSRNYWFCTSLLSEERRVKDTCLPGNLVWADLDSIKPNGIDPKPSVVIESSPGRYQALWRLDEKVAPDVAEDYSRKIGYKVGADKSGWDLTQLLRVPFTLNVKYDDTPEIKILSATEDLIPLALFEIIEDPQVPAVIDQAPADMPNIEDLPDVKAIFYAHRLKLREVPGLGELYSQEPPQGADWSRILWRLILTCLECELSKEETFAVAMTAKCNKYERDNRPMSYLWREVVKADLANNATLTLVGKSYEKLEMPRLVDEDDITEDNFINDYKKWGDAVTDAPIEYHELSCFIALSALLCGGVKLATSFAEEGMVPNLWGLILGESTLTRKTTVMKMATNILLDLDDEVILATDGSAEGLLTGLSTRPSRVSIFYKDEVSGFFDSMNRKDYLAGLPETLTQLYDVPKVLHRLLRKETITISNPYFIFFGGGIRDKVYSLVNEEYVLSGFLPRFLVVSGENDLERIRRTGPPTQGTEALRMNVVNQMIELKEKYSVQAPIQIGEEVMMRPIRYSAQLDAKAWSFYGDLEMQLIREASASPHQMMALPTFQRLAFSMLKMAVLIAATRREVNEKNLTLTVTKDDLKQAAWYIQRWGRHSVDLITNAGRPTVERMLDKVLSYIRVNQGITKSILMNRFHLQAREAREILETLSDRGLIDAKKSGRGVRLYTVG